MIVLFLNSQEPNVPVYYPSPNVRRPVTQLTEEEQVKIAKRIGLIQNLPSGVFDGTTKTREYENKITTIPLHYWLYCILHCNFVKGFGD